MLRDDAEGALDERGRLVRAVVAAVKPVLADPQGADGSRCAGAPLVRRDPSALRDVVGGRALRAHVTALRRRHACGLCR